MKRPQRPVDWQLDLLLCGMMALLVAIMFAHIAPRWEILVETGWAALTIGGMSVWIWANWPALRREEREQRAKRMQDLVDTDRSSARTLPLTRVQRRYLDAMRRHEHTALPLAGDEVEAHRTRGQ